MPTPRSQEKEEDQGGVSTMATSATTTTATTTSATTTASASARIISGSVGSLVTALAVTPLEVVKVHLQNARPATAPLPPPPTTATTTTIPSSNVTLCPRGCGTFILNNGLFDCVLPKSSVPYFDEFGNLKRVEAPKPPAPTAPAKRPSLGTFGMIRRIFIKDGFQGIYAGLGPTLVMGIPSTAFYYSVYDEFVANLRSNPRIVESSIIDPYVPLLAGSSARLLSTMLTAPLELIRTRQASAVGEGKTRLQQSMIREFQSIVRQEGCGALYKGLAPTLWRDVPFSGIYWLSLEQFKQFYATLLVLPESKNFHQSPMQQAGVSFLSGASAGMVAAACTTPFDVVKTRQQAVSETIESVSRTTEITPVIANCTTCCNHDGQVVYRATTTTTATSALEGGSKPPSASVFAYMRTIYETEGVTGLWRGNQTRMIKVAPSCAIMITCYELGKRMLQQQD